MVNRSCAALVGRRSAEPINKGRGSTESRPTNSRGTGILPDADGKRAAMPMLHDAAPQALVFACEQLLREFVATLVGVAACAGKVMIDSRASGAAEVMRERESLRSRLPRVDLGLRERASSAHREKFRGDANEARQQQLFAIQLGPKTHHGVE